MNRAPVPGAGTARSPRPGSRPVITTRAPSRRNRPAMARPRPVVPPVISARFPASKLMAAQSKEPLIKNIRHAIPPAGSAQQEGEDGLASLVAALAALAGMGGAVHDHQRPPRRVRGLVPGP